METGIIIITVILIIIGAVWFYITQTVDKPDSDVRNPPTDNGWIQVLEDLETALAGVKTTVELKLLLDEFKVRIDKYVYHVVFMSKYTELINNWKNNH